MKVRFRCEKARYQINFGLHFMKRSIGFTYGEDGEKMVFDAVIKFLFWDIGLNFSWIKS
jgi:hypothetical protein